jgi:ATP-dependent helicase/nuclease subunit A
MSADETGMRVFDPGHSAWVAANAGAGKTYTLTNRVARLLLDGARPEHILCLTYTKAAAAEMQERLFDQLGRWSMLPDAALAENIRAIGGAAAEAKALAAARRLFAQALETPGGLKVLTIHAFCQIVLSRFPIEAGVAPGFEVLDEATAAEMIAAARRRILERAGDGDAALSRAVSCLVVQTSEASLQRMLDTALRGDRRRLDRFFQSIGGVDPVQAAHTAHGLGPQESVEDIVREFRAGCSETQLREIAAWLGGGGKTDAERAEQILRALALTQDMAFFTAFQDIFLTGKGEAYARFASDKAARARPDLLALLQALERSFLIADDRFRAARAAGCAGAALTLIQAVRRDYQQAKQLRGVLDYDDLILRTLQLLEKRDAAAWVLFKLDGGLEHILVDEAQDTSPEQWAIVRKLTEEFFAGSGRERRKPRTIFAVGDEKQSIFSFQGADPALFEVNRAQFRSRVEEAGLSFADELLPMSRRSAPQILDFVDAVFADEAAREGLTSGGIAIRHLALRDSAKGRVEVWSALKPVEAPQRDPWAPVNVRSEDDPVVRLAAALARQIKGWIGTRIDGHDRAVTPGDIMILLPRREPFGSAIIRQLKLLDVPVAGADRIILAEQIAVMDLMALGRFVLLPEDDLNLAALLRSPLAGLSEEELFALRHDAERGLWQELAARRNESASFAAAADFLSDMLARADYAPPFEFYAHALIAHGGKQALLARLGAEAGDAIEEFLSLALEHERGRTPSLQSFLHGLARGGDEIKRDMERGQGQVRVMTVHGAKGLEADIVILPDTTSLPEPPSSKGHLLYTPGGILFPLPDRHAPRIVKAAKLAAQAETLREHRRLLYVALTRARDRLYICGFENSRGIKPQSWHAMAQQAARGLGRAVLRNDEEIFVHGEDSDASVAIAAPSETAPPLPAWVTALPPREEPTPRLIRPSDAVETQPVFAVAGVEGARRFRRGLLIHALLARLPEVKTQNRHGLALRFLTGHGVESDAAGKLAAETLAVLDDPVFAAAFAPGSRAEAAIVADLPQFGPNARVTGRIDRLAVTDDAVLIVDFKTNRPPPGDEADVDPVYLRQMALYRAAATKLFPEKRIACALIWTDGPRLLRLSDAILDAQAAKIAARLDPETP